MRYVNWGFASLGYGPEVATLSGAVVRFKTDLVDGSEDTST
jgi:hypothetical protein